MRPLAAVSRGSVSARASGYRPGELATDSQKRSVSETLRSVPDLMSFHTLVAPFAE